MVFNYMLYYGEAKACTGIFAGPAFIYGVEPFKDPVLVLLRDADSCIFITCLVGKILDLMFIVGRQYTQRNRRVLKNLLNM